MSETPDSESDASLFDRLAETLRHPWVTQTLTFASIVFLIAAWQIHGQGDVYNRLWLSRLFAGIGLGYFALRAWAGGLHRWLARVGGRSVRRARSVEIGVSRSDVAVAGIAALVVVSGFVAVMAVDSPTAVQNGKASGVSDETVAVALDSGTVTSISTSDGSANWNASIGSVGHAAAASSDGETVFTGNGSGGVVALDASDGSVVWESIASGRGGDIADIDATANRVYVAEKYGGGDSRFIALDPADGAVLYNVSNDNYRSHEVEVNPNETLAWHAHDGAGMIGVNPDDGSQNFSTSGTPYAAAAANGYGFAGENGGVVQKFNDSGVQQWSKTPFSDHIFALDAASDASAVYGGDKQGWVQRLDSSGSIVWNKTSISSSRWYDMEIDESAGVLYAGNADNSLYAIDSSDGSVVWSSSLGSTVKGVSDPLDTAVSSSGSSYTHTFQLTDHTGEFPDPTFRVEQYNGEDIQAVDGTSGTAISTTDWTTVEETTFNHNDRATVEMEETARHRLTLTDGDATYQEIGFEPAEKANPYTIEIGTPGTPTPTGSATATPTNTSGEACEVVQADDGDYELSCNFDDEVTSYDFNLSAPNGSYYEGELDFDEPTSYYEGEFDQNFTENLTDGESVDPEALTIDYSGTYANGTSFNGTTSLFGTSDDGGGFSFGGPTGKSGGGSSGLQQAGGIALLGGVAILGYRRISDQSLTETATSAASTASSAAGRVASAASGVVGRLRGGGRG